MVPLTKCHDGPYVPPRSNFYTTSHTLVAAPEEYEQYTYMKSAGHVFAQGPSMGIPPPQYDDCLLYTSPSPRDATLSRMPSSA